MNMVIAEFSQGKKCLTVAINCHSVFNLAIALMGYFSMLSDRFTFTVYVQIGLFMKTQFEL